MSLREAEATKQSRKKCSGQILQSLKNEIANLLKSFTMDKSIDEGEKLKC